MSALTNLFLVFTVIGTLFYGCVLFYTIHRKYYKFFKTREFINDDVWAKYLKKINSKNALKLMQSNYVMLNTQTNKGKPHSAASFAKMHSGFLRERKNALKTFFNNITSEEDIDMNLEDVAHRGYN